MTALMVPSSVYVESYMAANETGQNKASEITIEHAMLQPS